MKAYGPFQQRVADDLDELNEKHKKLIIFIRDDERFSNLPVGEQVRLKLQESYMALYAQILYERVNAFDTDDGEETEVSEVDLAFMGDYYALVGEVAEFDTVAAEKLRTMPSNEIQFNYSRNLSSCFAWAETNEGFLYWTKIDSELCARRGRKQETK